MSDPDNTPAPGSPEPQPRALPQVRLVEDEHAVRVHLADGSVVAGFRPFGLPAVPQSLTDWTAIFCERFWADRRRCVAMVLMLDLKTRGWAMALPAQRCGRDAACWSTLRADFPQFPDTAVLCGTFQSRVLAAGEDPADAVPPVPGLHFVLSLPGTAEMQPGRVYCFVRTGAAAGSTRLVPADDVILDDWAAALEQALPRLTMT
jgi:hypothetical protein